MRWPPYKHVFFDCDSTLTTVEGIDVLAQSTGKAWRVEVLTRAAMEGDLDLADVYDKRLTALKPTRAQVNAIRQVYKRNIVADAASVISALQDLGHSVYIISGGLAEPVTEFGLYLGVPRQNIRAVSIQYDELSGLWWQKDQFAESKRHYLNHEASALTISDGKARIMREMVGDQPGRVLLVGDGLSDLLAGRNADLFTGFGGVARRERVASEAPCYITSPSLAPLLALAAGPASLYMLRDPRHSALAAKSKQLIDTGAMTFNNERLSTKFRQAYQAIHSGTY
ncbi:MAG TPA: HAD-IB family phosphatase [Candidatus Binatia bacterium]|nr:HAD-IB family phosphatase [Candidatus Binatia bacterium]